MLRRVLLLLTFKLAICVDRKSERIDPPLCLDDFFRANPTILSILQLHGFVAPSNVKDVHCALSAQNSVFNIAHFRVTEAMTCNSLTPG